VSPRALPAEAHRRLRALLARGERPPEAAREDVALAAREGEVVLIALAADPALAPWLAEPARRHLVVDGHLDLALAHAADALRGGAAGRVALLKGSASARQAYPETALRFRRDVDLLVEDLPAARAALARVGFGDHMNPSLTAHGPAGLRTWAMAWPTAFGQVEIDLHARLVDAPWCAPDVALVLARATPASPLPMTLPADTLVHTAVHLVDNGLRQPLKAWVDLARLPAVVTPDALAAAARAHGACVATWPGLHVAARWLDEPVTPHLAALGAPPHARLLAALLAGEGAHPHTRPLARGPARHVARLLAADGLSARARYIAWVLQKRMRSRHA